MNFIDIKPGDVGLRMLGGTMPMELRVIAIDQDFIYAGLGWNVDRAIGAEVDRELRWNPRLGVACSVINGCRSS